MSTGPTDHTIFKSIYFHDPNGHRLELAANVGTPDFGHTVDGAAVVGGRGGLPGCPAW